MKLAVLALLVLIVAAVSLATRGDAEEPCAETNAGDGVSCACAMAVRADLCRGGAAVAFDAAQERVVIDYVFTGDGGRRP